MDLYRFTCWHRSIYGVVLVIFMVTAFCIAVCAQLLVIEIVVCHSNCNAKYHLG